MSSYTLYKSKAEKIIDHSKKLKLNTYILRIPEINTKQNLSILNENFPNFRDLLFKNKQLRNKVLFLH